MVGDGPLRSALEAQAAALNLSHQVTWLGTRSDVPQQLAEAHLFALVSRQEGFPIAILEAMRAGLPVVASDVGGVREAVQPERTGLLVPRGDAGALADALEVLLADPRAARRWDKRVEQTLRVASARIKCRPRSMCTGRLHLRRAARREAPWNACGAPVDGLRRRRRRPGPGFARRR